MRSHAVVDPRFWTGMSRTGTAIRDMGPEATVVALYLVTSPHSNALGAYCLDLAILAREVRLPVATVRDVVAQLQAEGFVEYFEAESMVWVPEMARFQIGERMKAADHRRAWAQRELRKFRGTEAHRRFLERYGQAYGLEELERPLRLVSQGDGDAEGLQGGER